MVLPHFGCVDYSLKLFCFTIVAWVLWLTRNKSRIQHVFPKSPIAIMYKTDSLLQSWKILLRWPDQKKAEDFRGRTADWMKTFVMARSRPDESDWCWTTYRLCPSFLFCHLWPSIFFAHSASKLASPTNFVVSKPLIAFYKSWWSSVKKLVKLGIHYQGQAQDLKFGYSKFSKGGNSYHNNILWVVSSLWHFFARKT